MHTKEHKAVQLSMIAIFLWIMIVYVLLFQVKGKELTTAQTKTNTGTELSISIKTGDAEIQLISALAETGAIPLSSGIDLTASITTGTTTPSTNKTGDTIHILSGTNIFYGTIAAIEKLGIKYKYALVDSKSTYFVYLGTPKEDITSIIRTLKWSLYVLKTEAELTQNKLFGQKVTFINLPEYKDQKVLMMIELSEGTWLIQMDYALYHKSKWYLKSLFIQ